MRELHGLCVWAVIFPNALSLGTAAEPPRTDLNPVSRANLWVTEGTIEQMPGGLSVSVLKMRAYLNASTLQIAEAEFMYLGSTGNEARLGSGERT